MARSAFESVIQLQLDRFSPEKAKALHIRIAKETLAGFLARQQEKPAYQIEVDGRVASSETGVRPYGIIVYRFLRMQQIGRFAIQTARDLSPVLSGEFKTSWFLLADDVEVAESAIPASVQRLIVVNDMPYARKIERRGARLRGVPPGIVERVRQLVLRRYSATVTANIEYLTLKGGHVLRKNSVRVRSNGRRTLRKTKGQALTYPALILSPRV